MKLEEMTDKLIDHIYRNVDVSKLDDWNKKFIESSKVWWAKNRKLSDKQKTRLSQIWEKQIAPPK